MGQVEKMEVTAKKDRTKVDIERIRLETISKAEADAEARRVSADVRFTNAQVQADAERQRLLGEAKAMGMESEAEAEASKNLVHIRKHDLDMKEKDVLKMLAEKSRYNLIGKNGGDQVIGAVMDGQLALDGGSSASASSPGWFK